MKTDKIKAVKGTVSVQFLRSRAGVDRAWTCLGGDRAHKRNTALITGGTSGIGAAYALAFGTLGYDLVLVGLEVPSETIRSLESLGEKRDIGIVICRADLAVERDIEIIERLINERGDIEVLVNCAGFGLGKTFEGADLERESAMIMVHCLAPMRLIRAALPHMRDMGRGAIINASSIGGFFPMVKNSVYGATKAFLTILTESLHMELRGTGIKAQVIAPGFVITHFHDRINGAVRERGKRRFLKWMTAEQVVRTSLQYLERGKVVCIPGFQYRILCWLGRLLPRWFYYRLLGKV